MRKREKLLQVPSKKVFEKIINNYLGFLITYYDHGRHHQKIIYIKPQFISTEITDCCSSPDRGGGEERNDSFFISLKVVIIIIV